MIRRRQFALENNISGRDIDRRAAICFSFRPGMKIDMSMMFPNTEEVTGACPGCREVADVPENTTVEW